MTRAEYLRLSQERPEMKLPKWHRLTRVDRRRAAFITTEEMVSRRLYILLARDSSAADRLQPISGKTWLKSAAH